MSQNKQKILIIDDEQGVRMTLYEVLTRQGYDVFVAENGRMGLDLFKKNKPDMVVSDIEMPELDGIEFLRQSKEIHREIPVVMMTGYGAIETAVAAMKNGAFDYLLKPFSNEVIIDTVERVLGDAFLAVTPDLMVSVPNRTATPKKERAIVGNDERFIKLLERAKTVASSKATVLILGESGTGKEVFARYIHSTSDRRDGPFVALNCAALPEGLLESELFGHEKGAFTGAIVTKKGKFELADGGTLLLDEIGEIPLHLQAKLLRVLQEEEVDRLGGKTPYKIDVHVVATTNRDLKQAVDDGDFRQDLYYRLNVIPLRLPSLRERKEDIITLADYFIVNYSKQYNKKPKKISELSESKFMAYSWPGNVRELENLVERAVLLSVGNELEPWDFWDEENAPPASDFAAEGVAGQGKNINAVVESINAPNEEMPKLKDVERQMILQSLQKTDDNRTHAAKMLGISVRTLRNKLHEYRNQGLIK